MAIVIWNTSALGRPDVIGPHTDSLIEVATTSLSGLDRLGTAPARPPLAPITARQVLALASVLLGLGIVLPVGSLAFSNGDCVEAGGTPFAATGLVCAVAGPFFVQRFWKLLAVVPLLWSVLWLFLLLTLSCV